MRRVVGVLMRRKRGGGSFNRGREQCLRERDHRERSWNSDLNNATRDKPQASISMSTGGLGLFNGVKTKGSFALFERRLSTIILRCR